MARLHTITFEWGDPLADGFTNSGGTYTTTNPRTGARAFNTNTALEDGIIDTSFVTFVTGRNYFFRDYVRINSIPAGASAGWYITTPGSTIQVAFNENGEFYVPMLPLQTKSRQFAVGDVVQLEIEFRINTGSNDDVVGLRINGDLIERSTSADIATGAPTGVGFGVGIFACDLTHDDIALNDDQGSSQNSWPGEGKCDIAFPISDSTPTPTATVDDTWKLGADTAPAADPNGDRWQSVNNIPPTGKATADALSTDIIENRASTTTDYTDMNCETYATLGIDHDDQIKVVQMMAVVGCNSSSGSGITPGKLRLFSNPDDGSDTAITSFYNGSDVAGVHPTGWARWTGPSNHDPSVTLSSSPKIRMVKNSATTRRAMVDAMGVIVEWQEYRRGSSPIITGASAAAQRASRW